MEETSGLKQYHLSPEAIEELLQNEYGYSIKPVDQGKLRKLRIQQQRQATMALNISAKDKNTKQADEPEEDELKELEELEEIESL
jgi:hypothetical protein